MTFFLQSPKQRLATSQLAFSSSHIKTGMYASSEQKCTGLKKWNACSWTKNRAENNATARLTIAPAASSCALKVHVSNIQNA